MATGALGRYLAVGVRRVHITSKADGSVDKTANRNHSYIAAFDVTKPIICLESVEIRGKKSIDNLTFACNDTRLVATFRDRVIVLQVNKCCSTAKIV